MRELRIAVRRLSKAPTFSAIVVLLLALTIGLNSACLTIVDALLFRDLAGVAEPGALYQVVAAADDSGKLTYSANSFDLLRRHQKIFASMYAASYPARLDWDAAGGPAKVRVQFVSGDYFQTLGVRPEAGRLLSSEDANSRQPAVVLRHGFVLQFTAGAFPAVQTMKIGNTTLAVVGVADAAFHGDTVGDQPDVWVPLWLQPDLLQLPMQGGAVSFLHVVGRIDDPASISSMNERLAAVLGPLNQLGFAPLLHPVRKLTAEKAGRGVSRFRVSLAQPLLILTGIVLLVLFLACANVATMMLTRSLNRQTEVAICNALGAHRRDLIAMAASEAVVLGFAACAGGLLIRDWAARLLLSVSSPAGDVPQFDLAMNWVLLAATAGVGVLTIGITSFAAVLQVGEMSSGEHLKARGHGRRHQSRWSRYFVAAQVAISCGVLFVGLLFVRTLSNLNNIETGFRKHAVIQITVSPGTLSASGQAAPYELVEERFASVAGVRSAGFALSDLLGSASTMCCVAPAGDALRNSRAALNVVTPAYFEAVGLPVLAGRAFRKGDPVVVVVSETLARRFWGSATSAVGRRLAMGDPPRGAGLQVVGVVRDIKQGSLRSPTDPALYLPYGRMFGAMQLPNLFINTAEHSGITLQSIRKELQTQIPSARVAGASTVEEILARNLSRETALSQASAMLGLIALGVTALGLYGVVRGAVSMRRTEFGVRMALGATTRDLRRLLARDVTMAVIAGIVAGLLLGVLGGWYAKTLLFGLAPGDPLTLIAAPLITVLVACAAVMLASLRLLALSPAVCLRPD